MLLINAQVGNSYHITRTKHQELKTGIAIKIVAKSGRGVIVATPGNRRFYLPIVVAEQFEVNPI